MLINNIKIFKKNNVKNNVFLTMLQTMYYLYMYGL